MSWFRRCLVVVSLLATLGVAGVVAQEVNLTKVALPSDRLEAADILEKWLQGRGFECSQTEHTVVYTHQRVVTNLLPITTDEELDRLQVATFYKPKDEFRDSPKLHELAMKLNKAQNMLRVLIDDDGDLACYGNITFVDELSAKEFDLYVSLFSTVIKAHVLTEEALEILQ